MFVPISFSDNLFVLRKISVSPAFWEKCILSSLSCVSYRSKVFLKKISFDKIVSLKKTKLLLSPLDFCSIFFFESKNSSIFQLSFYFLVCCVFLVFSFSVCFFLVSFIFSFFFNLSKQKIFSTKALSRKKVFWNTFSFELFLRKEHILIQKRMCSNMIIRIFFKKKISLQKKNLFQDSHALRIPCAIESPLDHCCVSWRTWASKVYVHSVVIDLGRGHLLHQAISHTDSAFLFF